MTLTFLLDKLIILPILCLRYTYLHKEYTYVNFLRSMSKEIHYESKTLKTECFVAVILIKDYYCLMENSNIYVYVTQRRHDGYVQSYESTKILNSMLCLMVILIITGSVCSRDRNAGSTLFYNRHPKSDCWTEDDMAKLRARRIFEELIPPEAVPDSIDDNYIKNTLRYFKRAIHAVEEDTDRNSIQLLKQSLSDAIGAHLTYQILPAVRFAYYAGYVQYRNARHLQDFLGEIKTFLNTQGMGWKRPERVPQWSNLSVAKVVIGSGKFLDPCSCLVSKRDASSCIHLPLPKLDDDKNPSAIALPFKSGGLVNLASQNSENILLTYYTTASRCILHSSPANCRHSDFVNFNNEMWHWMKRDVAPHLMDEQLYAAYGGVLRIAAAVQNYGKGLTRRNLFEYQDAGVTKWHPWKALTESYIYVNADWTPKLYIGLVLGAAVAICLLQICYSYIFGEGNVCPCTGHAHNQSFSQDVEYANVETNFPSMLPCHSAVYFSEKQRTKRSHSKSKTPSLGSIRTQKVYDLNENAEKFMSVIISDNEDPDEDSTPSKIDSEEEEEEEGTVNEELTKRSHSPPELETSIAQLRINRSPRKEVLSRPMYSTSTMTHSDVTFCQEQLSDSITSLTGSMTSDRSASSQSSKSRTTLHSRSSRDLAWARRVVSKQSARTKTTSRTELDMESFMTPPSQR